MAKSATHFKRVQSVALPSGETVELCKPSLMRLIAETDKNDIPQYLTSIVAAQLDGGVTENATPNEDDIPRMMRFMDIVVAAALSWPVVVKDNANYDAGEILITDLDDTDRQFIFTWAMPEAKQAVTSFPQ